MGSGGEHLVRPAKIVLLVLLAATFPRDGVYLAWVVPMVLLFLPVNVLVFGRRVPRHAARDRRDRLHRRDIRGFFAADYVGALFMFGAIYLSRSSWQRSLPPSRSRTSTSPG